LVCERIRVLRGLERFQRRRAMSDGVRGWRPGSGRERDTAWFTVNPDRGHRLRPAYEGEWPPGFWVVIRQVVPGEHLKHVFVDHQMQLLAEPPEGRAWAVFELVAERIRRRDNSPLSWDEIRAHQMRLALVREGNA
jgi:hypothetical protein